MLTKSEVLIRQTENQKLIVSVRHSDKTPPAEGDFVIGQSVQNGSLVAKSGIVVKVLQ